MENILGDSGLVGRDVDLTGRYVFTRSQVLERRGRLCAFSVAESLDGRDLGLRHAAEFVTLGCVHRDCDRLSGLNLLERAGRKAGALIVDVDSLEWECIAVCFCQTMLSCLGFVALVHT